MILPTVTSLDVRFNINNHVNNFDVDVIDIGHENTKDYESFDLNLETLSASEVADALWDKIAAGIQKNVA